jgi:hypothetical protein
METVNQRILISRDKWLSKLEEIEGWKDWKSRVTTKVVWFDDPWASENSGLNDFELPAAIDKEHAVITSYLSMESALIGLRDLDH